MEIHLSSHLHGEVQRSRIHCVVRDVDSLAAEYAADGGPILHDMGDHSHGMRKLDLKESSGNCICPAQPIS